MEKINYVAKLKSDIQILEEEQRVKGQQLKDQLYRTYESFKPAKLLGLTMKEMVASPHFVDNVIDTGISLATGYLSRRIVVGASGNIIRKLLGTILQVGVTKIVAQHSDTVKSFGKLALRQIFRKKTKKTDIS